MRSNGLLKWLLIPVALLVLFVAIRLFSGGGASAPPTADGSSRLTPEEMKALGIEGDTPRDTVATLVAQVKQLRTELQTALSDNRSQREENQRLRQREGAIDSASVRPSNPNAPTCAVTSSRRPARASRPRGCSPTCSSAWTASADVAVAMPICRWGWAYVTATRPAWKAVCAGGARRRETKRRARQVEWRHKLPHQLRFRTEHAGNHSANRGERGRTRRWRQERDARLYRADQLDADGVGGNDGADWPRADRRHGERSIPLQGLGRPDNLTANGIDIPDVAGAVFSGTASGDWTLSCVRGQVRSITFVFHDGTIRTIPEDREGNQQNNQQRDGLGWISDPHGIPCVSGERRSNAQQYLGTQALITAAGAGVASLIESDNGRASYVGADGSIGSVGISGQEAVGRILASGVQDMSSWVNKLYGQAFAAVYVQPGAKVAVHLEKPLAIDFDPEGRKVDHRAGDSHALELE